MYGYNARTGLGFPLGEIFFNRPAHRFPGAMNTGFEGSDAMTDSSDDTAALAALDDRRYAAMLAGDTAVLEELLHDDLCYMHSTGGSDTKQSYIAGLRDGAFVYRKIERDDQTVRVHGDLGMVFNHMQADVEIRGNLRHLDNRLLAVWTRDGGKWRLIGLQSGSIPEPAA